MATWTGTTPYASKKQLVSSISGLYTDLEDFQFSTINSVSTLNVKEWLSVPVLYVSDIKGYNIDLSGIVIDSSGVFVTNTISSGTASFGLTIVSTFQFNVTNTVKPSFNITFDLGFGAMIGGALAGLGAIIGSAIAGTGALLGGAATGLATLINPRDQNLINNNYFETINGSTQLQISTLGNDFAFYSSITRLVSSVSPNQIPGKEIFVSTIFGAGTTCIRSVSDPHNIITGDSNIASSTIQSFGQWIPLPDATGTVSTLTSLTLSDTTDNPLLSYDRIALTSNQKAVFTGIQYQTYNNDFNFPYNSKDLPFSTNVSRILSHTEEYNLSNNYVSTPWIRFQSTITDNLLVFLTSGISTPAEITYSNDTTPGDIAICEPDETNFRSTGTFDFIATGQEVFIQWGLAVDGLNSTIGAKTAKRVSWDIPANYSNFIDIPVPESTIVVEIAQQILELQANPHEFQFLTLGAGTPSRVAWDVNYMTFGSNTTLQNYSNYPYQFNSSVFVNGVLEANTIIALSSIFAVSTFVDTQVSTQTIIADKAIITEGFFKEGYISTLKASSNYTNDYIYAKSRMRLAGFDTPLGIVVGTFSNLYDPSVRFDFVCSQFNNSFSVESRPLNQTLASFTQSNVTMCNLVVENLTAGSLVYSNAEAPYITTSTIEFGWNGSFAYGGPVEYSLQQSLSTPAGTVWTNYTAASNQVLNIMAFSNSVTMLAQQFSTPLQYINTQFDNTNIQGWTSTIFYNDQATAVRVYLAPNAGAGEVSIQAQTFNAIALMNQSQTSGGVGCNIPVIAGSTYKFTSDGTSWTTNCNAPLPGVIQYNNKLNLSLDFENVNFTTTDTLNLNAETINLNGQVIAPNIQLENLYLDGFVSTNTVRTDSGNGYYAERNYVGPYAQAGTVFPLNLNFSVNSTDFYNIRQTLIPSRGYNSFNSFNLNEWNNTMYNITTTPAAGRPVMIVGENLQVTPSRLPYSGQFFVNNTLDGTPLAIPIYLNTEGVLSNIGFVGGGTYGRVFTTNGTAWSLQTNIPNPQGSANVTYNNFYQVGMNSMATTINSGMPMIYNMPSLTYNTNKTTFYSPQIRVATIDAPSFNTREAGMENVSYFDESIVFSGGPETWQSDAFNPILNYTSNSYYSIAGWEAMISISRVRTDNDIPIGWEVSPTIFPVGGGAVDYIWGSARYIQVRTIGSPSASLIERYLMIPKNYFNFTWQGQGPIN